MSIKAMEREIAELKQRLEKVEARVRPSSSQRWRAVKIGVKIGVSVPKALIENA